MSLVMPGSPAFAYCTDNLTGVPSDFISGTNFTAGANNVDGATVTVLPALAHDVHYIIIQISGLYATNEDIAALLDVVKDPAGGTAWVPWINDLVCGFTPRQAAELYVSGLFYHFPIYLKAGHSVGVRCRTNRTADITTGRVVVWAYGEPKNPDVWWCGSRVESLGVNPATSKGTAVTPGNAVYGAWATIGTSTFRYSAIQIAFNGTVPTGTTAGYFYQIGTGSTKIAGSPTLYQTVSGVGRKQDISAQPIWCDIPSGTALQARMISSTTAVVNDGAIYGVG